MRRRYGARQAALIESVRRHLAGLLDVEPDPAGLHLIARLGPPLSQRLTDLDVERTAAGAGVAAVALSRFYAKRPVRQGLLLGYAAFDETAIDRAARQLGAALGPVLARAAQNRVEGRGGVTPVADIKTR